MLAYWSLYVKNKCNDPTLLSKIGSIINWNWEYYDDIYFEKYNKHHCKIIFFGLHKLLCMWLNKYKTMPSQNYTTSYEHLLYNYCKHVINLKQNNKLDINTINSFNNIKYFEWDWYDFFETFNNINYFYMKYNKLPKDNIPDNSYEMDLYITINDIIHKYHHGLLSINKIKLLGTIPNWIWYSRKRSNPFDNNIIQSKKRKLVFN